MNVKTFITSIALAGGLAMAGCKKTQDQIKETLLTNLITGNIWLVTKFQSGGVSIVPDFDGYEFQFNKDGSVNAIKNGTTEATGTWQGSEAGESISSNFPGSTYPINKLNGVWVVFNTDLSPKLVDATYNSDTLRLNAK